MYSGLGTACNLNSKMQDSYSQDFGSLQWCRIVMYLVGKKKIVTIYGGRHQKSCPRQDFCARTSDEGYIQLWGCFPRSGLGLALAHVRDFRCRPP